MEFEIINSLEELQAFQKKFSFREAGSVYALLMEDGTYKIGYTHNPVDRYRNLQWNGYRGKETTEREIITFPYLSPGKIEAKIHSIFERNKVEGELFRVEEEEIKNVFTNLNGENENISRDTTFKVAESTMTPAERFIKLISEFPKEDQQLILMQATSFMEGMNYEKSKAVKASDKVNTPAPAV